MNVATAHLRASPAGDFHAVLDQARRVLQVEHGIMHATLQVEPVDHTGCAEVGW
jgi:cobalt-zinc-cadmium efflux system protein